MSTTGGESGPPFSGGYHAVSDFAPVPYHGNRGAGNPFAMTPDGRFIIPEPPSGPAPTPLMEYAGREPQRIIAELMPGSLESVPGSSAGLAFAGWDPVSRMPIPRSQGGGSSGFSSLMPPQSSASLVEHQEMSFMLHAAHEGSREGLGSVSASPYMVAPPSQDGFAPLPSPMREKLLLADAQVALAPGFAVDGPPSSGPGRQRRWRRPAFGGRPVAEGMQDVSDASSDESGQRDVAAAAATATDGDSDTATVELAAEGLEALPAMVSGVTRPTSGSGSVSVDDQTPSAGLGSRPTSTTETGGLSEVTPVAEEASSSLQLRLGTATSSPLGKGKAEESPPEGPVASFMLDSLQTDSHNELTMALLPDGGGRSGAAVASSSGFGSPLKNGGGLLKRDSGGGVFPSTPSGAGGAYKLLLQPLPESFSSIPEAWSSHRSSGAGSVGNSLLNSTGGVGGSAAAQAALSSGGGGNVEVLMTHDTLTSTAQTSTAQTSTTGTDPRRPWHHIARRQVLSPEQARLLSPPCHAFSAAIRSHHCRLRVLTM